MPVPVERLECDPHDERRMRDIYHEFGAVVLRSGLDKAAIDNMIGQVRQMLKFRLNSIKITVDEKHNSIDDLFNLLCNVDRSYGSEIFESVRSLEGFYGILHDPTTIARIKKLFSDDVALSIPFAIAHFRIDKPHEDNFLFSWHQDYTYNLMGKDAVTTWIPLTDITEDMGYLRIIPEFRKNVERIAYNDPTWTGGQGRGGHLFNYVDLDYEDLEKKAVSVPARAGDLLMFNSLTLHRSGANRSNKTRWVVNPRYGNILSDEVVNRGFVTGSINASGMRNNFREIHPDLVAEVPRKEGGPLAGSPDGLVL